MEDIESRAIQNYQENMEFFKEKHSLLYNKILALDTILNDGIYPQKYDLEYKDGYFDIVELKSQNMLYNQNSISFSKNLSENISLQKNIQSFKSYRKLVFDEDTLELLKTQNAYTDFISVAHIIDYYNKQCDDSMNINRLSKYIFLGTGLGIHIENIVKKFNIPISFILEDDIELFRLSLFTTNYKDIFQNRSVYFSIAQNQNELHKTFNNFFLQAFFKNHFIKYSLFSTNYEDKIDSIRSLLISRPEATYSNERIMTKNKRVINKINEKYKFLNLQKKDSEEFFKDKPWLVVGAGPSLHKNIEWLKQNKDKYIIIAVFASLKTLKKANISPDIAVQIDENDFTTNKMLINLDGLDFIKNTLLIFSASVSKLLFDKFDKENIYLHEDRTKYKLDNSTLAVTSVGETIYSISLIFNSSNIYLLGLDLALGDDGKTHSDDHFRAKTIQEEEQNDDFQLSDNIINVKGNLKERVKTLPILALSIPVVNYKTSIYKSENQNIYNLSENGAYFNDTIPLKIDKVQKFKPLKKDDLAKELSKIFDKYSTNHLDTAETQELLYRKNQIDSFIDFLNVFKTSPHSNDDIFLKSFENLVSNVFNDKYNFELKEILTIYFLRISPFIDDLINTNEVKNKKKHVKKLKHFIITQVDKIITTYKEDLNMLNTEK